jgi:hypothetical protein
MSELSQAEQIIRNAQKETHWLTVNASNTAYQIEAAIRLPYSEFDYPHLLAQLKELQRRLTHFAAGAQLIQRTTLKQLETVVRAAREHDD